MARSLIRCMHTISPLFRVFFVSSAYTTHSISLKNESRREQSLEVALAAEFVACCILSGWKRLFQVRCDVSPFVCKNGMTAWLTACMDIFFSSAPQKSTGKWQNSDFSM